jgi:hypothetical protein
MDLSSLFTSLERFQEEFRCHSCQQRYSRKWFDLSRSTCFFCRKFPPVTTTYRVLLQGMEWCFIQSGEDNQKEYYTHYLQYACNWCKRFGILPQPGDLQLEQDLCS